MTFIRMHSVKRSAQVSRRVLLLLPLTLLGAGIIRSAYAQSRNIDGTFLIDARVNGSPAVLMLDTGTDHSLLDREFAQRLDLHPVAYEDLQTPYSSEHTAVILVPHLDIQSIHSSGLRMMTDDLAATSRALGVHIDGVLGNDVICKFTITLDYSVGAVTFGRIPVAPHRVPIKLYRMGNRYFAHLNLDGFPLTFLLDTGTNFSVLSNNGWSRLNQDKKALSVIDGVRSSGTSRPSKLVCIRQMTIGHTSYENLPMRVQPPTSAGLFSNPDVDGLLGSDFLKQFVVSLDLVNDSLYLSPDPNFKADQDRFSTIGIQFAKDPTGFFTVMAVWSPTPASQGGLKIGDQILSVNGLSTLEMTQEDLSRQLHGESGRKLQVVIGSGENQHTVRLEIRNLLCQSPLIETR
jgi:predicted aspartyl protease